ncbi:MAG: vWA domain-containing protein [Hyphomicrobiaceae bacterium]
MLVFDASGSMASLRHGRPKIITAVKAASDVLPDVTQTRPTGLVTYGGRLNYIDERNPSCGDVRLRIPPIADSGDLIVAELRAVHPNGQTPLSDAVMLAAETLIRLGQPGVIVVLTDGIENCGFDTCAAARTLRERAPKIRVHIIGFHLRQSPGSRISCLPQLTRGTYTSTNSLDALRAALREKLGCPRISSYRPPARDDVAYRWSVGADQELRGRCDRRRAW